MKLIRVFLLLVLLTACSAQATPTTAPSDGGPTAYPANGQQPPPPNSVYPAGGEQPKSPEATAYPAGTESTAVPQMPTLTPDSTKAMVKGTLLYKGQPAADRTLVLAKVLKDADGKEVALQNDKSTAPYCITDSQGNFVFMNVPVDSYGVLVDTGEQTYALNKPNSSDQLRVVVPDNKTVDLGSLDYQDLP